MTKRCVFVGPTRLHSVSREGFDIFPPAALGSVFRAVEAGYEQIGIIDGYFGSVPGVWHKEILFALNRAEVWGAASTGAMRAAELHHYGMRGVGAIFRLFRRGSIVDDDEVCVAHAVAEFGYAAVSHAMINVRATLRLLRRAELIDEAEEKVITQTFKTAHFADRTDALFEGIAELTLGARAHESIDAFRERYVDLKARDAQLMCRAMVAQVRPMPSVLVHFVRTAYWVQQFERNVDDIPPLGVDPRS